MKVNDKVKISPDLTALADWIDAVVINVEDNRYNGIVISAQASNGLIYFGQERFFELIKG